MGQQSRSKWCLNCHGFGIWVAPTRPDKRVSPVTRMEADRRVREGSDELRAVACPKCGSEPPEELM